MSNVPALKRAKREQRPDHARHADVRQHEIDTDLALFGDCHASAITIGAVDEKECEVAGRIGRNRSESTGSRPALEGTVEKTRAPPVRGTVRILLSRL